MHEIYWITMVKTLFSLKIFATNCCRMKVTYPDSASLPGWSPCPWRAWGSWGSPCRRWRPGRRWRRSSWRRWWPWAGTRCGRGARSSPCRTSCCCRWCWCWKTRGWRRTRTSSWYLEEYFFFYHLTVPGIARNAWEAIAKKSSAIVF